MAVNSRSRQRNGQAGRIGQTRRTSGSRWRVVELVVACVLGVGLGVVYWGWGNLWSPLAAVMASFAGLTTGLWLLGGVLGGLVVRRPGAAVLTELVAAVVESLMGNQWGFSTVWYGLLEGLGAEIVFAAFAYRRWGPGAAVLAGLGAAVAGSALDVTLYYPAYGPGWKAMYVACELLSGAVIAGFGGWLLTRALAQTGALAPLASGRAARRV